MPGIASVIFLVGPMGSGKTTIGRQVAERLGLEFFDCDEEIEKRTGASINLIFDIEGEAGFRQREAGMLKSLAEREGALIATGGGVVLSAANRRLMKRNGFVVWLRTPVEHQLQRLENDKQRPLLQGSGRRQKLENLAKERDPLYREVADMVFESRARNPSVVARDLAARLLKEQNPEGAGDNAVH